jgi:hypothetical protein
MRCSCSALNASGQDFGTGRRGAKQLKSARLAASGCSQRCHAVLTVVGEHAIDDAIERNDSPDSRRLIISIRAAGPKRHLRSCMSGSPSGDLSGSRLSASVEDRTSLSLFLYIFKICCSAGP